MKTYRVWISPKEYVDIEAECPGRALGKLGRKWVWKIEKRGQA